jgi:hypothetical protein
MNESQNNMDMSFDSKFNNTTRERDSNSSTVISDIEMNDDENNKLDLSHEISLVDSIKKGK